MPESSTPNAQFNTEADRTTLPIAVEDAAEKAALRRLAYYQDRYGENTVPVRGMALDALRAGLAALSEAGLVVVPREPTDAMVEAFINGAFEKGHVSGHEAARDGLRAALASVEGNEDA